MLTVVINGLQKFATPLLQSLARYQVAFQPAATVYLKSDPVLHFPVFNSLHAVTSLKAYMFSMNYFVAVTSKPV